MRVFTLISATAIATAALLCSAASAAPAAPAGSSAAAAPASQAGAVASEPMLAVQTISRGARRMPPADAATLAGDYPLSDGTHLRVSYERQRLFADLGERHMELTPAGGTTYIGRGTAVSFTFDQVPFATDVTVVY